MSAPRKTTTTRRVKARYVEITITGHPRGDGLSVADVLGHCISLASQGKSGTLNAPGITASVVVGRSGK